MAHNQTVTCSTHNKIKLLNEVVLLILVVFLPLSAHAAATVCPNAAPATIDMGDCTVAAGTIPTTVNFVSGTGNALLLNGEAPTGAVTNTTDGEGIVGVIATSTSAASFGVAGTGDLQLLNIDTGITFNLGHNAAFTTITNAGTINQTAGTVTVDTLNQKEIYNQSGGIINAGIVILDPGKSFTQSGTGVLNVTTGIFLQAGSTLTLANQGSGKIGAANDGDGALIFAGNYNTDTNIADFVQKLGSITVNDGVTLTLDQLAFADTVNVGQGTSGIINHTAGALNTTTLNINAGADYNLSGSAFLDATTITIDAGGVLDLNPASSTTVAANISGNGAITKSGAGGAFLTGAATHTGGTTINAGGLVIGDGGTTGSISGNITNNSILAFDRSNDITYSGVISGTGGVQKFGAGKLTLGGSNTYTGGTFINDGTVSISADANLGNAAGLLDLNGATLETTATLSMSRNTSLSGSNFINVTTGTTTLSGTISGSGGGFTKQGTGTLILSGTNSYTGGTTVSAGTLTLQGNAAIANSGAVTVNGGILDIDAAETIGSLSGSGGIVNLDAALSTGGNNASTSYSGVIQGGSSLTKQGSGTFTLTGANTYSGGTTVSAGILQGTTTSLQGNITNNAVVTFNQNTPGTYSGVMSGTGSLTKSNVGTVTLSGANTYTGGTTINGGTLSISADNNLGNSAGTLSINNNASLQTTATFTTTRSTTLTGITGFDVSVGTLTHNGVITGTGQLVKVAGGTLILGNAGNNYSGGTAVNGGTLQGTTSSLQGTIINNAAVVFDQTTTGTYSGAMSGTGSLTKSNTGTVILTGANTYSGGSTISAGTLQIGDGGTTGSITGNVTNNGILIFNRSDAVTYGDVISGTGGVSQEGTGSTNLTNTNTYSGTTTINNGTLFVNGSIANSTTSVNAGGILGGTGTVGNVNVSGGTFAPGNSIGTINVTGNVNFSGGGIYQVEVDAAGNSDLINATGTATLTNGSVQVIPEAGTYDFSTDYTILTAAGGLVGNFNSATSTLAFLDPTLSYDANNVFLNLKRNDVAFSAVAGTPNQIAVANLLELLSSTNADDIQVILAQLTILTASGAQQAYDSLSGVQHTNAQQLIRLQHQQFLQMLFNRTGYNPEYQFAFNPVQDSLLAYNATGMNAGDNITPERGWWLQGLGRFGEFDDTSNATGADYHSAGLAFGVDTEWRDWVIGIAGGFTNSDADTFAGDLDVDSFHGAVYAGREFNDGIYMNAAAGFGYHDTDADRTVTVGTLSAQASADYDALTAGVGVEVGKDFELSSSATLTPYVGIEYTNTDREDFTETGAGVMNLSVDDEDHDSLRTTLGIRVTDEITTGSNLRIKPYAYAAYVREHLDTEVTMEAGFSAAPTSTFRIDGTDLDRNRAQVGAGMTGQVNNRLSFNVGYNGEIAASDDHHGVSATVEYTW